MTILVEIYFAYFDEHTRRIERMQFFVESFCCEMQTVRIQQTTFYAMGFQFLWVVGDFSCQHLFVLYGVYVRTFDLRLFCMYECYL